MLMKKLIPAMAGLALTGLTARGDLIAYYNSTSLVASIVHSNVTASSFGAGHGTPAANSASGGTNWFALTGWESATVTNRFFTFTVTPEAGDPGYRFTSITSLVFVSVQAGSQGPEEFYIRSSADGFANNLASGPVNTFSGGVLTNVIPLSIGISSGITIHIHGFGVTAGTGGWRVSDIALYGTVALIPEPSSALLFGLALGAIGWFRRQRGRR
jgi:hypothetical protein